MKPVRFLPCGSYLLGFGAFEREDADRVVRHAAHVEQLHRQMPVLRLSLVRPVLVAFSLQENVRIRISKCRDEKGKQGTRIPLHPRRFFFLDACLISRFLSPPPSSTRPHRARADVLTLPFSCRLVIMQTMEELSSHTMRQKSANVPGSGPCVATYACGLWYACNRSQRDSVTVSPESTPARKTAAMSLQIMSMILDLRQRSCH